MTTIIGKIFISELLFYFLRPTHSFGLLKENYKALILDPKSPGFFGILYEATTIPVLSLAVPWTLSFVVWVSLSPDADWLLHER